MAKSKSKMPMPFAKSKGAPTPPAMANGKMSKVMGKKSRPSTSTGSKMCPACTKAGASSCPHM